MNAVILALAYWSKMALSHRYIASGNHRRSLVGARNILTTNYRMNLRLSAAMFLVQLCGPCINSSLLHVWRIVMVGQSGLIALFWHFTLRYVVPTCTTHAYVQLCIEIKSKCSKTEPLCLHNSKGELSLKNDIYVTSMGRFYHPSTATST